MVSQITRLTIVYSRRRSKKIAKLHFTGLCARNLSVTGEFPAQRPVTQKTFPFYDIIMPSSALIGGGCRTSPLFLAATKQLYEWFCPSVRHTFLTMFPSSYHHEIFRSYYQWQKWCPCKRSRSKVKFTEVMTPFSHFWTVTPVWIHLLWWTDAYSLIMLRRGALLFFKVVCQISRSHGSKNRQIWPKLGFSGL